jgi:hypothetical protein
LNKEKPMKNTILISALAIVLAINANPLLAAEKEQDRDRTQDRKQQQDKELKLSPDKQKMRGQGRDQERIYGSQLMTEQERTEYRTRMRTAKTSAERQQIRKEHHEQMKARAKEQGVTLPDEPPAKGMMMEPMGPDGKMGPGGGMGSGMGSDGGGRR